MLPKGGEMHIHIGSNKPLQIQVKDDYHLGIICVFAFHSCYIH